MRKFILVALLLVACVGCGDNTHEIRNHLGTMGTVIGTLPDGRDVRRYDINYGAFGRTHYVYVVDSTTSVSSNFTVPQGKTSRSETHTTIQQ
jgi:hypothetical protein